MGTSKENKKVFIDIVAQLRDMIETDGLVAGDKIPSERELSERLQVGRSSVREALRALELLGLIETRRGEGTFISNFRNHQLVQLLSTFILQEKEAQVDVFETKLLLEMESIRKIINNNKKIDVSKLTQLVNSADFTDDNFFEQIMRLANNNLTLKMWLILKEYFHATNKNIKQSSKENYLKLVEAIVRRDIKEATTIFYKKLRVIK